jgi:tetratricopeptide (TPR) repeat protein
MRFRSLLVTAILVLTFWGCSFSRSGDVYRPLHNTNAPDYVEVEGVLSNAYPQVASESIHGSLKRLAFSRSVLGPLTGYSDWANYLSFEDIRKSIDQFNNNPFAWALLANYLSLERQPNAAVVASDHALRILEEVRSSQLPMWKDLNGLFWTASINRAIFLNIAGAYPESLKELESINTEVPPEPFLRLAIAWVQTEALIGSGQLDDALALLDSSSAQWAEKLPDSALFDSYNYPQYFEIEKRKAIFLFLKGEALLRKNKTKDAELVLRQSIASDSQLWVSHLSLGTVLYQQGRKQEALKVLTHLVHERPKKSLFAYNLAVFNLANLNLEEGRVNDAIEGYRHILDTAARRDEVFEEKFSKYLPDEVRAKWVMASDARLVSEARNNLAIGLLQAATPEAQQAAARQAVELLEADKARSRISVVTLARANWLVGSDSSKREAIEILANAPGTLASSEDARNTLLSFGLGSDDPNLTFSAMEAYVGSLKGGTGTVDEKLLQNLQDAARLLLNEHQAILINTEISALLNRDETKH